MLAPTVQVTSYLRNFKFFSFDLKLNNNSSESFVN